MIKKTLLGKITSDKMQKTVVVSIDVVKRHSVYDKIINMTKKIKARNEIDAKLGDLVRIEECKPFSKEVSWKVTENLGKKEGK